MPIFRNYVLAGYPVLWIETYEEFRAMTCFYTEMQQARVQTPYKFYSWDCADGLKKFSVKNGEPTWAAVNFDGETTDPLVAMSWFGSRQLDGETAENSVLFMKDLHRVIDRDVNVRKIRNLIPILKASGRVLVVVSPVVQLPAEIEKSVTVIKFNLPNCEELRKILKGVVESANENKDVHIEYPKQDQDLIDASKGMTTIQAENAYSKCLVDKKAFDAAIVRKEKAAIVRNTGLLEVLDYGYGLESVGGLECVKDWLNLRKDCFSPNAHEYGIPAPKGLMLVGVPGTGKTLIARAVAYIWNRPIMRLNIGKVMGQYVGQSENNLERCLSIAEAVAPSILMIDEFEKSFAGAKGDSSSDVVKRMFGNFLTWVSDHTSDVFIVATANEVQTIPAAMLRCGRFDTIFWVDLPGTVQRKQIISIHLSKINRKPTDYDIDELAKISDGFTGAEIETWITEALTRSYAHKVLKMEDLRESIKAITPITILQKEEINASREWARKRGINPASYDTPGSEEEVHGGRRVNV